MTHAELVARAARWLRSQGCPIVFAELVAALGETPDAIGWRNGVTSYLIEAKASRADFLADRHKPHRRDPAQGMGVYRYFMCPPDMIRVNELPPGWGLLYCRPKTVQLMAGQAPKSWRIDPAFVHQPNRVSEMRMLISALNRLRIDLGEADFTARVHMPFMERQRAPAETAEPAAPL